MMKRKQRIEQKKKKEGWLQVHDVVYDNEVEAWMDDMPEPLDKQKCARARLLSEKIRYCWYCNKPTTGCKESEIIVCDKGECCKQEMHMFCYMEKNLKTVPEENIYCPEHGVLCVYCKKPYDADFKECLFCTGQGYKWLNYLCKSCSGLTRYKGTCPACLDTDEIDALIEKEDVDADKKQIERCKADAATDFNGVIAGDDQSESISGDSSYSLTTHDSSSSSDIVTSDPEDSISIYTTDSEEELGVLLLGRNVSLLTEKSRQRVVNATRVTKRSVVLHIPSLVKWSCIQGKQMTLDTDLSDEDTKTINQCPGWLCYNRINSKVPAFTHLFIRADAMDQKEVSDLLTWAPRHSPTLKVIWVCLNHCDDPESYSKAHVKVPVQIVSESTVWVSVAYAI
jgi:hypothetical protein